MESIQSEIEQLFLETLHDQLDGCADAVKIVVAYSGGPDSTVLLYLLKKFQKQFRYRLEAAHVNHGIRSADEMLLEEKCVHENASHFGISLHEKRLDPGFLNYYAKKNHCGMEVAARVYRYRFFEKLLNDSDGSAYLAVGHNRNDQVETIVMRLFTGSGIEGLKGIPHTNGKLIRPLIHIDREMILSYLDRIGTSFVHDSSNGEDIYLRNRIRNVLLHQIQDVFPDSSRSLTRIGSEVTSVLAHYNSLLERECPWVKEGDSYSCFVSDFIKMPYVSRKGVVLKMMNALLHGDSSEGRIHRNFFLPLDQNEFPEGILLKGHKISFFRKRHRLVLQKEERSAAFDGIFFHMDMEHSFTAENFRLEIQRYTSQNSVDKSILFSLKAPTAIVRTPYSKSERHFYTRSRGEDIFIVQGRGNEFCVINSKAEQLDKPRSCQKRSEIDPKSMFQCVIIKGRGDYAPG